jgi:hypothetical protein
MQALMAMRTSGTHCSFWTLISCAVANAVLAAIARQTDTANFAAVDWLMISLHRMLVQIAAPQTGRRPFGPARRREAARARSICSRYRVKVLLRLTVPP